MSDENNEGVVMPNVVSDKPVTEEVAQPEVSVDSSSTSEENHEQKTNGVQKRINDLTAQKYQEARRAEEAEAKLAEYQQREAKPQVVPQEQLATAPTVPEDIYDEDAMRQYYADSQAYNLKIAQDAAKSQLESQQNESVRKSQEAKQKEAIDKYAQNATRDGVDFDKLLIAERNLKANGLSNELGQFLMNDTNGAKIVSYLNDNPAEMHEILSLDPVSAGIRIATEIKPKAISQTPRVSGAPEPIPEVTGGGYADVDEFSKQYPCAVII